MLYESNLLGKRNKSGQFLDKNGRRAQRKDSSGDEGEPDQSL